MYQALYRKYRPKNFDEVVGQKYVIQTLKNEILNDKINHAYMFFGPRGIGKTTIAKIFARAVNCENPIDGEPCNQCKNCLAILNDETTDKRMKETESIIYSMTLEERRDPSIITLSRKQRIAKGCGKDLAAINRLLKQFEQSKQMMKQMSNMDMATGLPKMGGGHFVGGPNRKKVRHKKKKKK